MVWRPESPRRNPLHALRRIVETPGPEVEVPEELLRHRGEHGATVRVSTRGSGAGEAGGVADDVGADISAAVALAERPPVVARHDRQLDEEASPQRSGRAERPPTALITSTPGGMDHQGGTDVSGEPPRHTAAGAWSTTVEAPMSTPTWLRASPRTPIGGATGTVTGRSAILTDTLSDTLSDAAEGAPARGTRRVLGRGATGRRDPATGRRPMTARQVLATMLVCLGLWTVVDAPALYHGAATAPVGTRRTVSMDLLGPIKRATAALGLDRISHVADDLVGRHYHVPTPLVLPPLSPPASPAPASPVPAPASPSRPGRAVTTTPATVPPPAVTPLRVPTAANPLRVLVVGDSIGLSFGQSLANALDVSGVVHATVDAREGTGLARPDSFDWPAQLRADIVQFHPEVVVAMFGGNDDQDVLLNGRYVGFGSPLWDQIYGARVTQFADAVTTAGARLLWSGLPVMRSAARTARYATVMSITRAAVSAIPGAIFVDNYPTLAGPDGQYEDSLANGAGQQVLVREPDGIHLSPAGADRLASKAIAAMTADWRLTL